MFNQPTMRVTKVVGMGSLAAANSNASRAREWAAGSGKKILNDADKEKQVQEEIAKQKESEEKKKHQGDIDRYKKEAEEKEKRLQITKL